MIILYTLWGTDDHATVQASSVKYAGGSGPLGTGQRARVVMRISIALCQKASKYADD